MSEDTPRRVVSDTGPLISLEKITGGYRFIRRLYDRLLVPPAVLKELAAGAFESEAAYLKHYDIGDLIEVRAPSQPEPEGAVTRHLDEGERRVIHLALESRTPAFDRGAGRTRGCARARSQDLEDCRSSAPVCADKRIAARRGERDAGSSQGRGSNQPRGF